MSLLILKIEIILRRFAFEDLPLEDPYENTYLIWFKSGVAEHANLIGDMVPAAFVTTRFNALTQLGAHRNNAVRHQLYVF